MASPASWPVTSWFFGSRPAGFGGQKSNMGTFFSQLNIAVAVQNKWRDPNQEWFELCPLNIQYSLFVFWSAFDKKMSNTVEQNEKDTIA